MIPPIRQFLFAILGLVLLLPACESVAMSNKPVVVITTPASGAQFQVGQNVPITSTATDSTGVVRVELLVDSISVRTDPSPVAQGQAQFQVIQNWKASGAGTHTATVRAYDSQGNFGEAGILLTVNEEQALGPAPTVVISTPVPINTLVAIATDVIPTLAPTLTPLPTSTSTPVPPTDAPSPSSCTPNSLFVTDVTVPDYSVVAPGTAFTKAWRVQNNGTCAWDSSYAIMWVDGAQMAAQAVLSAIPAAQGATLDLAIPMTAPSVPGTYQSTWRLRDSLGNQFGTNLTVVIRVAYPTATPNPYVPTATPLPGTPHIAFFSCNPCTITAGQSTTLSWGAVTGATSASIDPGIGGIGTPGSRVVSPGATTTYVLTATGPGGSTQASVVVTVNSAANFAGTWVINFGNMTLSQSGNAVSGTYFNAFDGNSGTLGGTVSGNTMDGTWTKGTSGPVHLVLGASGTQINGYWSNPANKWCGARPGNEFPNGCSYDGFWNMASGFVCSPQSLNLRRVGTTVNGTFCGSTPLSGNITYAGNTAVLQGTWGSFGGTFAFYLDGYSGQQFTGHFNTNNVWCGWRNGSSQPNPCLE